MAHRTSHGEVKGARVKQVELVRPCMAPPVALRSSTVAEPSADDHRLWRAVAVDVNRASEACEAFPRS